MTLDRRNTDLLITENGDCESSPYISSQNFKITKLMKKDYEVEAKRLARVVEIAVDSFRLYPPKDFTEENLAHLIGVYSKWKESILNPEPKFRKIASLKLLIEDVFIPFQEGAGKAVEYFWKVLAEENLGYERKDKLQIILKRRRIQGRGEYDLVVDSIVPAMQEGRISEQEAELLSEMVGQFEAKSK